MFWTRARNTNYATFYNGAAPYVQHRKLPHIWSAVTPCHRRESQPVGRERISAGTKPPPPRLSRHYFCRSQRRSSYPALDLFAASVDTLRDALVDALHTRRC